MKIDAEVDFHGYTVCRMEAWLEDNWATGRWQGLKRVRVIHGRGEALAPAVRNWCDEKGIPWTPEPGNPGAIILHPALRTRLATPTRHHPLAKPLRSVPVRPPTPNAERPTPESEALFTEELARLESEDPRTLLRRKRT